MKGTIIEQIETEYHQILNRQEQLEDVNKRLQEALALTNAMILSGEKHSKKSKSIVHSALFQRGFINNEAESE